MDCSQCNVKELLIICLKEMNAVWCVNEAISGDFALEFFLFLTQVTEELCEFVFKISVNVHIYIYTRIHVYLYTMDMYPSMCVCEYTIHDII